ncbi:hypothetical protein GCM10022214_26550 [Actinomadura miaoliensis]|uniref:Uncharacterized protein n=1 Tax=Actinomadura miaoliensis TaxID=430685 RepID=A0ABP7VLX9_9ACTN
MFAVNAAPGGARLLDSVQPRVLDGLGSDAAMQFVGGRLQAENVGP